MCGWAPTARGGPAFAYNRGVPRHPNLRVRMLWENGAYVIYGEDAFGGAEQTGGGVGSGGAPHAATHDRLGPDPLYIRGLAFLPLAARPTSPPSMAVTVEQAFYRYDGEMKVWHTGDSASLSAFIPASPGIQHFIAISLDRATEALAITDGGSVASNAATPPFSSAVVGAIVETLGDAHRPIAAIRFYNGQTRITAADIFMDLRLWGGDDSLTRPLAADSPSTLTIGSGAVTATTDYHIIAAESGTSDDLETITAASDRQILLIQADSGDTITVKHGADNINLNVAVDFELSGDKTLLLFYDGTNWSDTGAGGGSSSDDDAIHDNVAGEINAITQKVTPVSGDLLLIEDSEDTYNKKKVTWGSLPSGSGSGDSSYTAAYASRPAAGSDGDLFLPSDGFVVERDTGAAWAPWGPIFPLTAPNDSGFSWANQGSAAISQTKGGITLTVPASASMSIRARVKTAPSTPYTITALMIPTYKGVNFAFFHLGFRDSSTGRLEHMRMGHNGNNSIAVATSSGPTADVAEVVNRAPWPYTGYLWMCISDNGTNFEYFLSSDGQNWLSLGTRGRTTYTASPDQVWWGGDSRNSSPVYVNLQSWKEE